MILNFAAERKKQYPRIDHRTQMQQDVLEYVRPFVLIGKVSNVITC